MNEDRTMAVTPVSASTMEQVVIGGDLEELSPSDRVAYYKRVCESVGLNPFTKPFQYIRLNGKLTLYAAKDCSEQLRRKHGISITGLTPSFDLDAGVYTVVATATTRDGRTDSATGAVPLGNDVKGEARANAVMKAETKAKRRVTLSISGLGWLDESETGSIPGAQETVVDQETGEIVEQQVDTQKPGGFSLTRIEAWERRLANESETRVATMGYPDVMVMLKDLGVSEEVAAAKLGVAPERPLSETIPTMDGAPTYLVAARRILAGLKEEIKS